MSVPTILTIFMSVTLSPPGSEMKSFLRKHAKNWKTADLAGN